MSSKPTSVRKFLLNVPPPSNQVKDAIILEELSKLQTKKLINKSSLPKPTTAQIIRSNALRAPEKRKLASSSGPLSEINPDSDRVAVPVKKFKRPSCGNGTLTSSSSSAAPLTPPIPTASPTTITTITTTTATATESLGISSDRHGSDDSSSNISDNTKNKTTDIVDILATIFQTRKRSASPEQAKGKSASPQLAAPLRPSSASSLLTESSRIAGPLPVQTKGEDTLPPSVAATAATAAAEAAPQTTNISPVAPLPVATAFLMPDAFSPTSPMSGPPSPGSSARPHVEKPSVNASLYSNADLGHDKALQLPSPPHLVHPASASSAMANPPSNRKKLSKNQQKKLRKMKKKAANATKGHEDYPIETKEAGFDDLFEDYQKASNSKRKPNQQQGNNRKRNNKTSNHPQQQQQQQVNNSKQAAEGSAKLQNTTYHKRANGKPNVQSLKQENGSTVNSAQNQTPILPIDNCASSLVGNKRSIEDISREIIGAPNPIKINANQPNKRQKTKKPFVPLVTCRFFANGYCKDGDACTFKHDMADVVARPNPKKNIVCEFFKTGSCCKFDACDYSHDLKLEPCKFFHLNNNCRNDDCPYSHSPLNQDMLAKLTSLTGPCYFYHLKGVCNEGDVCHFSHEPITDEQMRDLEKIVRPCKFFHLEGQCVKDGCYFSHEDADPKLVAQLKEQSRKQ